MVRNSTAVLGQAIRSAVGGDAAGQSDRDLLARFAERGDQSAFAALFRRHSGMVLGVCRRALATRQDAEDACQATFLVLSRKAGSGRWQHSVANWLYLTARRVARNARVTAARRARREKSAAVPEAVQPVDQMTGRELLDVLDSELDRLPPSYREPLVLCYLEGLTRDEAAARLGIPSPTVKIRLERGRKRLGDALEKRGCVPGAGLLALAATSPAGVSPLRLVESVLAAVTGTPPAAIAKLAEGVAVNGLSKKTLLLTLLVLGASVVGVGAARPPAEPPAQSPAAAKSDRPAPSEAPTDAMANGDRAVAGRVLAPDGKPVAGATVIIATPTFLGKLSPVELAKTDENGAFKATVKPLALAMPEFRTLVARAPGFAADWVSIAEVDSDKPLTFHLLPDDITVHGRVVSLEGKPIAGVNVRVVAIDTTNSGSLKPVFDKWSSSPAAALQQVRKDLHSPACAGVPAELKTDQDGRFEVKGVGRERLLNLHFEADGIESAAVRVATIPGFDPKSVAPVPGSMNRMMLGTNGPELYGPDFTHVAKPDAPITGVVTDARTGKPLAGVKISGHVQNGWWENNASTSTDANGRYRLSGVAKGAKRILSVWAGEATPYFAAGKAIQDTPGLEETAADFHLARGVVIRGRVTDKLTGKPVPGAGIHYTPLTGNSFVAKTPGADYFKFGSVGYSTDANGEFRLVAVPGVGLITAQGETRGPRTKIIYTQVRLDPADQPRRVKDLSAAMGDAFLSADQGIISLFGKSAYKIIDPAEGTESLKVDLQFETGHSVAGKVVGPDGHALTGVVAYGLTAAFSKPETLKDGSFTALALDPTKPRTIVFLDTERKLAGTILLGGTEKEPPVVKLQAWAAVTGRVVDADGSPCPDVEVKAYAGNELSVQLYHTATQNIEAKTGADGRFRLDVPFGGVEFRLGPQRKGTFLDFVDRGARTVRPGQTKDLGDLTVKPVGE